MRVMKFGGTSVGTVESLSNVKSIVENSRGSVVVVVSALGGVTDMLIKGAEQACAGSELWQETLAAIEKRHSDVVHSHLVKPLLQAPLWQQVSELLSLLRDYYTGIYLLSDLSARTLCKVVSIGERCSSLIVSYIIEHASLCQSMDFIKTEQWFGKNIADTALTDRLIRETFSQVENRVAVCPGFISTDRDNGDITNLGRGGSDYTAALIAAALDAEVLDIWTDVDGFMTADPRIIADARVIVHLSFLESMDLCNFGAKVIYPPTIYPVFHKNIPIRILNTFRPDAPGTIITDEHRATSLQLFRGVTSIADTSIIAVGATELFSVEELHTRVLNLLSRQGIEVLLSTPRQGGPDVRVAIRRTDATRALTLLKEDFAGEGGELPAISERTDVSTISAVGENLKLHPDTAETLRNALADAGIEVLASAIGASGFTFSAIVAQREHHHALKTLHSLITQ